MAAAALVLPLATAAVAAMDLAATAAVAMAAAATVVVLRLMAASAVATATRLALPVPLPGGKGESAVVVSDEAVRSDWLSYFFLPFVAFHWRLRSERVLSFWFSMIFIFFFTFVSGTALSWLPRLFSFIVISLFFFFFFLFCAGVYYLLSISQARRLSFCQFFSFIVLFFSWFRHGHSMQSDISILRFCSWLCEHLGRHCMKKTSHRSRWYFFPCYDRFSPPRYPYFFHSSFSGVHMEITRLNNCVPSERLSAFPFLPKEKCFFCFFVSFGCAASDRVFFYYSCSSRLFNGGLFFTTSKILVLLWYFPPCMLCAFWFLKKGENAAVSRGLLYVCSLPQPERANRLPV
jgi:hypothetical protein